MNNTLGKILIELRSKSNLTQKDLAEKLNVSDKAISRWETGSSIPHMEMLLRISKLFKISLQDLIVAAAESNETDNELVEGIIKEFTKRDRDKTNLIKIISISLIVAILVLIISIVFLQSYNRFKVYDVYLESDNIYSSVGIYVETKIRDSLYLNEVKIRNYEPNIDDVISIDLLYKDKGKEYILNNYSNLDNIHFVDNESYIKIEDLSKYLKDIYLRVRIIDKNNNQSEYLGRLQFNLNYSNNKIFRKNDFELSKSKIVNISPKQIKEKLLANGFDEFDDTAIRKKIKNGNIIYALDSNVFKIKYEKNDLKIKIDYIVSVDALKVQIVNSDNVEIEHYDYAVSQNEVLNCYTGRCNNYLELVEILKKEVFKYL